MCKNVKKVLYVFLVIFILMIMLTSCSNLFGKKSSELSFDNNKVVEVKNLDEMNKKLEKYNVKIAAIATKSNAIYGIENGSVATVKYKANGNFTGEEMTFLMKLASSQEEILIGVNDNWGTPILMRVECTDGSDIEVTSSVSMDNTKVMKAEWYDNDLYYCMLTDDLVTREDFLQEVNRVIITNHVE